MNDHLCCTFIGHSTVLLQTSSTAILTDPHFGERLLWFKRKKPLPFTPGHLPDLSCVLLSHPHLDHLSVSSFKYISVSTPIVVPDGCEKSISRFLPNPIIELTHFAHHELADGTDITAMPVRHAACKICSRTTRNNAYLIRMASTGEHVYFCADSAYGPHFAEAGNLSPVDIAILPIGAYRPRWLMRRTHMTPAEAVNAFEELRALHLIPIHHGTFRFSLESVDAPAEWLRRIVAERPELASRVHLLLPGEQFPSVHPLAPLSRAPLAAGVHP
jgi:L-ascorbate metabolism protein UlaG (beta-lactamase superfamily)